MRCPSPADPAVFESAGLGQWSVDHCLWNDISGEAMADMTDAILRAEGDGILPCAGGWWDQSEAFLMCYETWRRELAAIRKANHHGKEGR